MTIDEIIQILNASGPKSLTSLQEWLLREAWDGKTYSSMAAEANYVEEYLRKTAASLWSLLSNCWGEQINKHNFRSTLQPKFLTPAQQQLIEDFKRYDRTVVEFPNGPIPLDSNFYVTRPPVEQIAYEQITLPGSVTCIKGSTKMGKSSLLLRIVEGAAALQYCTASIDLQQADREVFTNIDKFLRWFSINVSRELQIESKLDDYWNSEMGSKVSCTIYFQVYLLDKIKSPLVLALNQVHRMMEYPEIAQDFIPLLQYWYEQSKQVAIWQKLRLVLAYSTEIYISLKLHQSPFNFGMSLKLGGFTKEQVQELALRYGLDWTDGSRVKRLMAMVGGHPYLVQLAFYYLFRQEMTLKQLLATAAGAGGIYYDYLLQVFAALEEAPELLAAFKQVVFASNPVKLEPIIAYKLDSLGLVTFDGDRVIPSCQLYSLYLVHKSSPQQG